MTCTYYAVEVPIRNLKAPGLEGVHVFTGRADSCGAAVEAAREAYDTAHTATESGAQPPLTRPNRWTARAYRPGWKPDWTAATAHPCGYTLDWSPASVFGL